MSNSDTIAKFEPVDPRFKLARAIFPGGFIDSSREYTTERVIAHLWERADQPELVETVARCGVADWDDYTPDGPLQVGLRDIAREEITAMLTALIGPRPTEQEKSDEV